MSIFTHSVASMSEICDFNGLPFENVTDQKEFIISHFANSFKKPEDEPDNLEGCIKEFLGDDICNHPLVRNLKLSENEKNSLELPFTADELSIALDGANIGPPMVWMGLVLHL